MRIRLNSEEYNALRAKIDLLAEAKNPVAWLYENTLMHKGDIYKAAGLSPTMGAALFQGKRPGPCQRAACRWALIKYELSL